MGVEAEVINLRSVRPLDRSAIPPPDPNPELRRGAPPRRLSASPAAPPPAA